MVPKDTTESKPNKPNEEIEIKKHETTKRKNLKEGLNVNKESGKIEIPKRLQPTNSKRISKPVKR